MLDALCTSFTEKKPFSIFVLLVCTCTFLVYEVKCFGWFTDTVSTIILKIFSCSLIPALRNLSEKKKILKLKKCKSFKYENSH